MTQEPTRHQRELNSEMPESPQQPAPPTVELAHLTRDQEEYVENIRRSVSDFDRSVVVGGPRHVQSAGE